MKWLNRIPALAALAVLAAGRITAQEPFDERSSPAAPVPSTEPEELLRLRSQLEERRAAVLRPIEERHRIQVRNVYDTLLRGNRPRDALAVQRYLDALERGETPPAPTDADPRELQAVRTDFATQSANAVRPLEASYRFQLDELQRRLTSSGDLAGAGAVLREMDRITPAATAPTPRFDWRKERSGVTYTYSSEDFARGTWEYADTDRKKLLDGRVHKAVSGDSVGWRGRDSVSIQVVFAQPVMPKSVRVAVLHAPTGAVLVPRTIVVREGGPQRRGARLGQLREVPPANDWVEVPLEMKAPSQHFWIELTAGAADAYLLIEEIEFR